MKYGKPIWQLVIDAANLIESEAFTSADIVKQMHETKPNVPEASIKSYVTVMSRNHPFSGHWSSARKSHSYFYYRGNGKFKLLKPTEKSSLDENKPV